MSIRKTALLSLLIVMLYMASFSFASTADVYPYGDYKKGTLVSSYGEKRPVTTVEEAKRVLTEYFAKKDVMIGEIKEKELFFEAEIRDKNNNLVDKVIIDKRTGRIRSIY
jgi:hypothetical protein